jgi:hypothetical protein
MRCPTCVGSYYNDPQIIAEHYDSIKAYMESQILQLDDNLVLSYARCCRARRPWA